MASLSKWSLFRFSTGLTAVEFLLGLAAASIVLANLVSGASNRNERLLVEEVSRDLQLSLVFARNQAIARGSSVRVCPVSAQLDCAEKGNWNLGWIIQDVDSNEVLRLVEPGNPDISVHASDAVSLHVQFNDLGDAFGTAGEFFVCNAWQPDYSAAIRISAVGQVEQLEPDPQACKV